MQPKQAKCKGTTGTGRACKAPPSDDGYCFMHSPARVDERRAARKAGGQARHTPHSDAPKPPAKIRTLDEVLSLLDYAAAEVVVMDNSIPRSKLLVQLAGEYARTIQGAEFEQRLAVLEAAIGGRHDKS